MLMTFGDIADPRRIERVDPANLAATFGPGYALRRITADIVVELVATGIDLPLKSLKSILRLNVRRTTLIHLSMTPQKPTQ